MSTKAEWKEAAERRLAENLALKVMIERIARVLYKERGQSRIRSLYRLVRVAKEIGK